MTTFSQNLFPLRKRVTFIKTQEFDSQPSETDKLMTNDTIIASQKLSQVIFMRKKQLFFLFFMGLWERMVLFRAFLKF